MTLYTDCVAAGIPVDNHESDLYVKDCPEARALLAKHAHLSALGPTELLAEIGFERFRSEIDGATWIDVPFAFDPWWEARQK